MHGLGTCMSQKIYLDGVNLCYLLDIAEPLGPLWAGRTGPKAIDSISCNTRSLIECASEAQTEEIASQT